MQPLQKASYPSLVLDARNEIKKKKNVPKALSRNSIPGCCFAISGISPRHVIIIIISRPNIMPTFFSPSLVVLTWKLKMGLCSPTKLYYRRRSRNKAMYPSCGGSTFVVKNIRCNECVNIIGWNPDGVFGFRSIYSQSTPYLTCFCLLQRGLLTLKSVNFHVGHYIVSCKLDDAGH